MLGNISGQPRNRTSMLNYIVVWYFEHNMRFDENTKCYDMKFCCRNKRKKTQERNIDVYNFICEFLEFVFSFFKPYLKGFSRKRAKYQYSHLISEATEENRPWIFLPVLIRNCPFNNSTRITILVSSFFFFKEIST